MNRSFEKTDLDNNNGANRDLQKANHGVLSGFQQIAALAFRWLRERSVTRSQRLRILERHALGPGQSLLLVEADGRSLLIASSREASPVFFSLDPSPRADERRSQDADSSPANAIRLERMPETSHARRSPRRAL
jgi:flagellar biogenesis protein FliO